jgi:hypothetical protein
VCLRFGGDGAGILFRSVAVTALTISGNKLPASRFDLRHGIRLSPFRDESTHLEMFFNASMMFPKTNERFGGIGADRCRGAHEPDRLGSLSEKIA